MGDVCAQAKLGHVIAVIKDYGDAFEGLWRRRAPQKSNRGSHLAVRSPKMFQMFQMFQKAQAANTKLGLRSSNATSFMYDMCHACILLGSVIHSFGLLLEKYLYGRE